tara:strand:- start:10178 stop:10564 length:387 start_codon:yes stop_codon:yes gene_type:complete
MVCVDSDILIDFLRNDKLAINKIKELSLSGNLSMTSINSFEILKGLKNSKMDRSSVLEFISSFNILNFDYESSEQAADIFNNLKAQGKIIELSDIMIASIVMANGEKLLTRNLNHFERIENLDVKKLI